LNCLSSLTSSPVFSNKYVRLEHIPDIIILSKNSSYRSKTELIEVVDYERFVRATAALESSGLINNCTAVMLKYHPSE